MSNAKKNGQKEGCINIQEKSNEHNEIAPPSNQKRKKNRIFKVSTLHH